LFRSAPGNRVTAFQNGDQICPAMPEAIRGARRTINMESYIYWSGDTGQTSADALCERARAGVAVHLVVDWAGSIRMDDALLGTMQAAGARVDHGRPLRWDDLGRLHERTHRERTVVGGRVRFTRGVGIDDQGGGHAQAPAHRRESHFRVEGPVVAQLQSAFNDNWIKTTGELLNGPD